MGYYEAAPLLRTITIKTTLPTKTISVSKRKSLINATPTSKTGRRVITVTTRTTGALTRL